jgi:hypothetical protein
MTKKQQVLDAINEFKKWYEQQTNLKTRDLKKEPPQWFDLAGITLEHPDINPDAYGEHSDDSYKKSMTIDESVEEGERINTHLHNFFKTLIKDFLTDTGGEKCSQRDLIIAEAAMKKSISLYSEAIGEICKVMRNEETKFACTIMKVNVDSHLKNMVTHLLSGLRQRMKNK